ncbi:hypothetical protein CCACVL1_07520 [Corchorus capsularis]|uniref:Myb/SANT-like domain-containing protein n=1 Tax=Corchorus capsularis TaxID=210143 RepID=A0A1R3J5J1_COCAP|nr:hypothetical protein CCACVL1_07520 [Corchorus capsularis]
MAESARSDGEGCGGGGGGTLMGIDCRVLQTQREIALSPPNRFDNIKLKTSGGISMIGPDGLVVSGLFEVACGGHQGLSSAKQLCHAQQLPPSREVPSRLPKAGWWSSDEYLKLVAVAKACRASRNCVMLNNCPTAVRYHCLCFIWRSTLQIFFRSLLGGRLKAFKIDLYFSSTSWKISVISPFWDSVYEFLSFAFDFYAFISSHALLLLLFELLAPSVGEGSFSILRSVSVLHFAFDERPTLRDRRALSILPSGAFFICSRGAFSISRSASVLRFALSVSPSREFFTCSRGAFSISRSASVLRFAFGGYWTIRKASSFSLLGRGRFLPIARLPVGQTFRRVSSFSLLGRGMILRRSPASRWPYLVEDGYAEHSPVSVGPLGGFIIFRTRSRMVHADRLPVDRDTRSSSALPGRSPVGVGTLEGIFIFYTRSGMVHADRLLVDDHTRSSSALPDRLPVGVGPLEGIFIFYTRSGMVHTDRLPVDGHTRSSSASPDRSPVGVGPIEGIIIFYTRSGMVHVDCLPVDGHTRSSSALPDRSPVGVRSLEGFFISHTRSGMVLVDRLPVRGDTRRRQLLRAPSRLPEAEQSCGSRFILSPILEEIKDHLRGMAITRNTPEEENTIAIKAIWSDELTRIFCELCVKEVESGNRPTTYLNVKGWDNVLALFQARTGKHYGIPQLKNKWDTLKKEWRLWKDLLIKASGIGWSPIKKTIDASDEWWVQTIKQNPKFKIFRKRGFDPELDDLLWRMFGGIVATGKHAWTPSLGVTPGGASTEDATPGEGCGDSDANDHLEMADTKDVGSHDVSQEMVAAAQQKGKSKFPPRKTIGKRMTSQIDKLCDSMSSPRKSVSTSVFPTSRYGVEEAMDALRAMENEVPPMTFLYYFALELFHQQIKREIFLNLRQFERKWWLEREYEKHQANERISSLLATPSFGFQPFHQTPPSHDMDDYYNFYQNIESNQGHVELSQDDQQRIATIVVQVEKDNYYHELEDNAVSCVQVHHRTYISRQPCMNSENTDTIKPLEGQFNEVPDHIRNDSRYWPHFKDCIGAIDGTHIKASISSSLQVPYIGTTHDTRIFLEALRRQDVNFPKPSTGKYYLVDSGYPQMNGYLGP